MPDTKFRPSSNVRPCKRHKSQLILNIICIKLVTQGKAAQKPEKNVIHYVLQLSLVLCDVENFAVIVL